MNVVMMTNTYLPHVGGVARSVDWFTERLRRRGHRVLVVAPTFPNMPQDEPDVLRVPALQEYRGSDFSVRLPIPGLLTPALDAFRPDVVHSHHPFLLGDTALRVTCARGVPLVFTHHTMYERYTHYVPGDSSALQRFAIRMATEYANLCDAVVAPSESVQTILRQRGVTSPITVVPTGIDREAFSPGDPAAARRRHDIPADAFVVGHVGRLAPEKNLEFLARAVAAFVDSEPDARFLAVGDGPSRKRIESIFRQRGLGDRLQLTGSLSGDALVDAYRAMDVFAFASRTETQGMVLAEAMGCAVPVVALDAPGAREVVQDGENGRLLPEPDEAAFADALRGIASAGPPQRKALREATSRTADAFSIDTCVSRLEGLYSGVAGRRRAGLDVHDNPWARVLRQLETEWTLWSRRAGAAAESIADSA